MTIKVTATKNASITKFGHKFTRGVTKVDTVSYDDAMALQQDKRFKVEITPDEHVTAANSRASGENAGAKPRDKKKLYAAINGAIGMLSLDDESNYTADGRPDARALTKVLGYQITAADRDAAMRDAERGGAISAPGENEAGNPEERGDVKKKDLLSSKTSSKIKLHKPEAEQPEEDEVIEADGDADSTNEEDLEDDVEADDAEDAEEAGDSEAEDDLIEDEVAEEVVSEEPAPAPAAPKQKAVPSRKAAKAGKLHLTKKSEADDADPSKAGAKEL